MEVKEEFDEFLINDDVQMFSLGRNLKHKNIILSTEVITKALLKNNIYLLFRTNYQFLSETDFKLNVVGVFDNKNKKLYTNTKNLFDFEMPKSNYYIDELCSIENELIKDAKKVLFEYIDKNKDTLKNEGKELFDNILKDEKYKKNEKNGDKTGYYVKQPIFGTGKPSWLKQQFGKTVAIVVGALTCILFYFLLLRAGHISGVIRKIFLVSKPIVYGLAIAYLLNPIVKAVDRKLLPFLEKKFPNFKQAKSVSRSVGICISIVILATIIFTLFNMMIPELYKSIRDMIMNVPSQMNRFIRELSEMNTENSTIGNIVESVMKEATTFVQNWMRTDLLGRINDFMSGLTVGVLNFMREIMNILIGLIVSVYVLFSKEKFSKQSKKITYAIFKPSNANMILHLTIKSNEIFGGFIIGKIIDSAIIGVLCFAGLSILNMPYAMLVSVIVGVTNVIPFFGPYIGAIPSAILILLAEPKMGIYFIIFIIALQQFDGNVLGPKILGDSTGLSAFWVVFSILIGGGLFGVPGMILGVPTFAVVYYIVGMLVNNKLEKKKLPVKTDAYDEYSYVESDGTYVHADKNIFKEKER